MGKLIGFVLVLAVAGGIIYAYLSQQGARAPETEPVPASVINGRLAEYQGDVILLDFWATWCGPCKRAMPGVQRIHEHFKDRPVTVIGANISENADPVAYMQENGYTYELMLEAEDLAQTFKVQSIPTFVILTPDGNLLHKAVGFNPEHEQEMIQLIEDELERNNL